MISVGSQTSDIMYPFLNKGWRTGRHYRVDSMLNRGSRIIIYLTIFYYHYLMHLLPLLAMTCYDDLSKCPHTTKEA